MTENERLLAGVAGSAAGEAASIGVDLALLAIMANPLILLGLAGAAAGAALVAATDD